MERRHHHQRSRCARGPPPLPLPPRHHQHHQQPPHHHQNPSHYPAAAATATIYRQRLPMEDDAISTLMDIDGSPLSAAGALYFDEEDGEGEMFLAPHRAGHGISCTGEGRGSLPFSGFYNSFDGADFDDADLA